MPTQRRPADIVASCLAIGAPCAARAVLLHGAHDHLANPFGHAAAGAGAGAGGGDLLVAAPGVVSGGIESGALRSDSGEDAKLLHTVPSGVRDSSSACSPAPTWPPPGGSRRPRAGPSSSGTSPRTVPGAPCRPRA